MNVFDALLMPLRLPRRVASDIATLVDAVATLQSDATRHLGSVDERAGVLVDGLGVLQASIDRIEARVDALEQDRMQTFLEAVEELQRSIDRIDARVAKLESLEEAVTARVDGVHRDLNERMVEVRDEVRPIPPAMDQILEEVKKIDHLLPDPDAGPLSRLKDSMTSP